MFIESTYEYFDTENMNQRFSSLDVACVLSHIATKSFLEHGKFPEINTGLLQVGAYLAQGYYIAMYGVSLFEDDFIVSGSDLGTAKILGAFGPNKTVLTNTVLNDTIKASLAGPKSNLSVAQNIFVQSIGHKYLHEGYKELMKEIRETPPFIKARSNELNIIKKADMKEYFEAKYLQAFMQKGEL